MSGGLIMLLIFVIRALLASREAEQQSVLRIFPPSSDTLPQGRRGPVRFVRHAVCRTIPPTTGRMRQKYAVHIAMLNCPGKSWLRA